MTSKETTYIIAIFIFLFVGCVGQRYTTNELDPFLLGGFLGFAVVTVSNHMEKEKLRKQKELRNSRIRSERQETTDRPNTPSS